MTLILTGVAIYAIGWFLTARAALPRIEDDMPPEDTIDRFVAALFACTAGLFWPLAAPVFLLLATSRKSPRELQREIDERNERIAQLERELGIGGGQ